MYSPTFVQRIFPVQTTCEPLLSHITAALRALLTSAAAADDTAALFAPTSTYSVMYKSRGNSSLDRGALFTAIGELLAEPAHCCGGGVSLSKPDCVVMCQMFPTAHGAGGAVAASTVCAISILPAEKLTEYRGGSINCKQL